MAAQSEPHSQTGHYTGTTPSKRYYSRNRHRMAALVLVLFIFNSNILVITKADCCCQLCLLYSMCVNFVLLFH